MVGFAHSFFSLTMCSKSPNGNFSSNSDDDVSVVLESLKIDSSCTLATKSIDYQILNENEVAKEMECATDDISSIIQYPTPICKALLIHFKWNKDTLLERFYETADTVKFFEDANLFFSTMQPSRTPELCNICFEMKQLIGMQCSHSYCNECWDQYLTGKITTEGHPRIPCPGQKCNFILISDDSFNLISNPAIKRLFHKRLLNAFIEWNQLFRWCPGADCGLIAKSQQTEAHRIACKCGSVFCFQCGEEWHEPVSCSLLKKWLKKCQTDSSISTWLNDNTKECPKCHATIEKNGGCNHMTCKNSSCLFEFCWTCLGPWKPHGSGYYACNRYNDKIAKAARSEQDKLRANLQRYVHYYDRYRNHRNSLKLENQLYEQVNSKMKQMQECNFSWIETQFLKKAIDVLGVCRRTLMYTYAFAYYLEQNNATFIFEDNQRNFELATEQLSEFLERDLDEENLVTLKQKVQDKYRYVEHRRNVMLKHCVEGFSTNQWKFFEENQSVMDFNSIVGDKSVE